MPTTLLLTVSSGPTDPSTGQFSFNCQSSSPSQVSVVVTQVGAGTPPASTYNPAYHPNLGRVDLFLNVTAYNALYHATTKDGHQEAVYDNVGGKLKVSRFISAVFEL